MSYDRVIPRDLFNEANLLKCYGQIYLELERGNFPSARLEYPEDGSHFDVCQDASDGSIYLLNVELIVRECRASLRRPLNSRRAWPLYLETEDGDVIAVFDGNGAFSDEMKAFLAA